MFLTINNTLDRLLLKLFQQLLDAGLNPIRVAAKRFDLGAFFRFSLPDADADPAGERWNMTRYNAENGLELAFACSIVTSNYQLDPMCHAKRLCLPSADQPARRFLEGV